MTAKVKKHVPMRRCVLCRRSQPRQELIRLYKEPAAGAYRLDQKKALGGRGTWVCTECAAKSEPKKLKGAFKGQAPHVAELFEEALKRSSTAGAAALEPGAAQGERLGGVNV